MTVKTMVARKCTPLRNAARHRQGAAAVERRAAAVERRAAAVKRGAAAVKRRAAAVKQRAAAVKRRAAAAGKEGYHVIYIVHTCTHVHLNLHVRSMAKTLHLDGKEAMQIGFMSTS